MVTADTRLAPAPAPNRTARVSRAGSWATVAVVVVLAAAFLLPVPHLLRGPAASMEEGIMLVFPDQVLHGAVPHKDFLHLYGPGSLWVLAAFFKVFGTRIEVERVVALAQLVGMAAAVALLLRLWGRWVALAGGLLTVLFALPSLGLTAWPWVGGVALGLGAIVALLQARGADARGDRPRVAARWAVTGGVLAVVALLYRIDLGPALALAGIAVVWGLRAPLVRRAVAGAAVGLSPYLVHLVVAGPANVWNGMIVDPVLRLRPTRGLPLPPDPSRLEGIAGTAAFGARSWPLPKLTQSGQVFAWFIGLLLVTVFLLAVAFWRMRRDPGALRSRALLAAALFTVAVLPQAVQRADASHLGWVSAVAVAVMPAAIVEVVSALRPRWNSARVGLMAGVGVLAATSVLLPSYTARRYAAFVQDSFTNSTGSFTIRHAGRNYYVGDDPAEAADIRKLLRAADRAGRPGDRLVVGTGDLRRTPYVDSFLYYLLPEYEPGTYFIEMEPGITNRNGTRLTRELRRADVVILADRWLNWKEPNDSMEPGDPRPNEVLREEFCETGMFGGFHLLVRCAERADETAARPTGPALTSRDSTAQDAADTAR
jgi:hypothetical protein